jgi:hypothetical protein
VVPVPIASRWRLTRRGVFSGDLGIDVVSVQEVRQGVEPASKGSFNAGWKKMATEKHGRTRKNKPLKHNGAYLSL